MITHLRTSRLFQRRVQHLKEIWLLTTLPTNTTRAAAAAIGCGAGCDWGHHAASHGSTESASGLGRSRGVGRGRCWGLTKVVGQLHVKHVNIKGVAVQAIPV